MNKKSLVKCGKLGKERKVAYGWCEKGRGANGGMQRKGSHSQSDGLRKQSFQQVLQKARSNLSRPKKRTVRKWRHNIMKAWMMKALGLWIDKKVHLLGHIYTVNLTWLFFKNIITFFNRSFITPQEICSVYYINKGQNQCKIWNAVREFTWYTNCSVAK